MWLIVGLGNPGPKYNRTPHNLGFDTVDLLAQRHELRWTEQARFKSYVAAGSTMGIKIFLMKPITYMNLSGEAVQPFAAFYKIPPEKIVVICDDVNLPFGKIRLRERGTHGGHNGLRSIGERLATDDYPRLRIGCAPLFPAKDLAGYVLSPMAGDAWETSRLAVEVASDCLESVLSEGPSKAMSLYNSWSPTQEEA
jgi:PTH1 family peptidyl-tRNA hydrolase